MVAVAQLPSILSHQTRPLLIRLINKDRFQTLRAIKSETLEFLNRGHQTDAKTWPNRLPAGTGSRRGAERQLHADERDQQQHHDGQVETDRSDGELWDQPA